MAPLRAKFETKNKTSDLAVRTISAAVLAPPVLAAVHLGWPFFEIMVGLAALILAWEWQRMCVSAPNRAAWVTVGLPYILLPCLALLWLRSHPEWGRETIFWLFVLVWATDIGAYISGRLIGGPRLASSISPNKTWAGLIGGAAAAAAAGTVAAGLLGKESLLPLAVTSGMLGILSQGGDLLESWVKRRLKTKDSGSLIPGHGGLLDRVDGLLAATAGVALIDFAIDGKVLVWL